MKEEDIKHLEQIYAHLIKTHVYEEAYFMVEFKSIIDSLKPAMKETKYKLVIPDEVPKEYMLYPDIHTIEGQKIRFICMRSVDGTARFEYMGKEFHCPKSWLVEIKEEPMTAEESFLMQPYEDETSYMGGWGACEKNEQLKHRETETIWESWQGNNKRSRDSHDFEMGWYAALKSRGYE